VGIKNFCGLLLVGLVTLAVGLEIDQVGQQADSRFQSIVAELDREPARRVATGAATIDISAPEIQASAETLRDFAVMVSLSDEDFAQPFCDQMRDIWEASGFDFDLVHASEFCDILVTRDGFAIHAWAKAGRGHVQVTAD
jgi:hypothetical protein